MQARLVFISFCMLIVGTCVAQTTKSTSGQALAVTVSSANADNLLNGGPTAWTQVPAKHVGLNRTPPLFDTDEPASSEILYVDVRLARAGGKVLVNMVWKDATQDAAKLTPAPGTAYEGRFLKVPTEADDRFFDAAAVMFPSKSGKEEFAPSLQMGDANHPVEIYYWNAARGAMVMQAEGRATTRSTGQTFPANGSYQNGQWSVTLELPNLPVGTTVAFAVWNGSQKDRDGRKYFSVWQVLE
jgi:hypothetical protein